jgi:hypothetical protein
MRPRALQVRAPLTLSTVGAFLHTHRRAITHTAARRRRPERRQAFSLSLLVQGLTHLLLFSLLFPRFHLPFPFGDGIASLSYFFTTRYAHAPDLAFIFVY